MVIQDLQRVKNLSLSIYRGGINIEKLCEALFDAGQTVGRECL